MMRTDIAKRRLVMAGSGLAVVIVSVFFSLLWMGRHAEMRPSRFPPPRVLAVTPDGNFVYIASNFAREIIIVSLRDGVQVDHIPIEGQPYGIVFDPGGHRAYALTGEGDGGRVVHVVDAASQSITARIAIPRCAAEEIAVAPDGKYLIVAAATSSQFCAVRVDTATFATADTVGNVGGTIKGKAALSLDARRLFFSECDYCSFYDGPQPQEFRINAIATDLSRASDWIELGSTGATDLVVSPDRTKIATLHYDGVRVTGVRIVSAIDGAVSPPIPIRPEGWRVLMCFSADNDRLHVTRQNVLASPILQTIDVDRHRISSELVLPQQPEAVFAPTQDGAILLLSEENVSSRSLDSVGRLTVVDARKNKISASIGLRGSWRLYVRELAWKWAMKIGGETSDDFAAQGEP